MKHLLGGVSLTAWIISIIELVYISDKEKREISAVFALISGGIAAWGLLP